jgi:hypothetical protein
MHDPQNHEFEIAQKEIANPTGLLGEVMRESLMPINFFLQGIIRDVLGDDTPSTTVRLCQMSIRSQCFDFLNGQKMHKVSRQLGIKFGPSPLDVRIEEVAAHITRFSLAGLREVRQAGANLERPDAG